MQKNNESFHHKAEKLGNTIVDYFHIFGLFVLGFTVIYAAFVSYFEIISSGHPTLKDILLIFIYLEVGAMIGIYFKTRRLPVQFLIYIAITALTRVLTIDIKTMSNAHILTITGAILMLVVAIYIINYTFKNDSNCETCDVYNKNSKEDSKSDDNSNISLIDIANKKPD
jgi:phosphate starvation-inducible membrane PsiE